MMHNIVYGHSNQTRNAEPLTQQQQQTRQQQQQQQQQNPVQQHQSSQNKTNNVTAAILSRCGASTQSSHLFHHSMLTDSPYCAGMQQQNDTANTANNNNNHNSCSANKNNNNNSPNMNNDNQSGTRGVGASARITGLLALQRQCVQQTNMSQEQATVIGYYPTHIQQKYSYEQQQHRHQIQPQHHHHQQQSHHQTNQQQVGQPQHIVIHNVRAGPTNTWLSLSQAYPPPPPTTAPTNYYNSQMNTVSLTNKPGTSAALIFPNERIGVVDQQLSATITPPPTARINRGNNTHDAHHQMSGNGNDDFDWFMRQCVAHTEIPTSTSNEHDGTGAAVQDDFDSFYCSTQHSNKEARNHNGKSVTAAAAMNNMVGGNMAGPLKSDVLMNTSISPGGTKRSADNDTSPELSDDQTDDDDEEDEDCLRLKMLMESQQVDMNSPTLSAVSGRNSQDFSTANHDERIKCKVAATAVALDEGTAGSRSRSSETYFWQYNVQAKGPKTKRTLHLKDKDPHVPRTFFDPVCQMKAKLSGVRGASNSVHSPKLRKGDGNDVTPNPQKLLLLGMQIKQLTEASFRLTPSGSEHKESLKREKNKLASRSCRLKKKAQHEANKLKLQGLNEEHSILLSMINKLRAIVYDFLICKNQQAANCKLSSIFNEVVASAYRLHVAGSTDDYVSAVLDTVPRASNIVNHHMTDFNSMADHEQQQQHTRALAAVSQHHHHHQQQQHHLQQHHRQCEF